MQNCVDLDQLAPTGLDLHCFQERLYNVEKKNCLYILSPLVHLLYKNFNHVLKQEHNICSLKLLLYHLTYVSDDGKTLLKCHVKLDTI